MRNGGIFMTEQYFYSIMKAEHPRTVRFGWVSPMTGITYCGICLRAAVTPKVGAECRVCGAHVAQLLDIKATADTWRSAWREAIAGDADASRAQQDCHQPISLPPGGELIRQD
jgi:hypothetical protein